MKKLTTLFYALACLTVIACRHHHHSLNISYNESGHYYSMKAHFSKSKTRDVEEYMDDKIGRGGNTSFVNTRIDGQLTLEDRTTFYIKKYPGLVVIRLDKNKNSREAYRRIRSMCEGIKEIVVN